MHCTHYLELSSPIVLIASKLIAVTIAVAVAIIIRIMVIIIITVVARVATSFAGGVITDEASAIVV